MGNSFEEIKVSEAPKKPVKVKKGMGFKHLFWAFVVGLILASALLGYGYFRFLRTEPIKPKLTERQVWAEQHPDVIDWAMKRYDFWQGVRQQGYQRIDQEVQKNFFVEDFPKQ